MRHFKIYDWIAPEGQLYRENDDGTLSVQNLPGVWEDSILGDLDELKSILGPGDRLEEVEGE